MIFTLEQLKKMEDLFLEPDGDYTFRFTGKGKASELQIREIKNMDAEWVKIFGKHLILNKGDLE